MAILYCHFLLYNWGQRIFAIIYIIYSLPKVYNYINTPNFSFPMATLIVTSYHKKVDYIKKVKRIKMKSYICFVLKINI